MKSIDALETSVILLAMFSFSSPVALWVQQNRSRQQDRAGIEQLHQLDRQTTLSGKADDLAKLWDKDAVRLLPDSPAEIGKRAIYATDKREESVGEGLNACYKPEIKDLQIAGDWAFEWGYFSYKASAKSKPMHGKLLRVIKKQSDGSWKFARVMAFVDKAEVNTPISDACK
jgi:ketosteroid isomerase-like protein